MLEFDFVPGMPARATADYEAAYPDPLEVAAGEVLELGRNDTEWPAWVWATNGGGKSGWVPEAFLDRQQLQPIGRMRCDYTARELTVRAGQPLILERGVGGWYWAVCDDGRCGWVPGTCVREEPI